MPETHQLALDLRTPAPAVSMDDVRHLVTVLREADQRLSAAQICEVMFGVVTESQKRKVRAIASAARPRVVSFPGSPGYALWEWCTIDEIRHAIEAMEEQGQGMIKDANVYRVALHRGIRGTAPKG